MNRSSLVIGAGLAAIVTACATPGLTPTAARSFASDSGGYIITLGLDTVAVERFFIRGNTLEAEATGRTPRTYLRRVGMSWNDAGRVTSYDVRDRAPGWPRDSARAMTSYSVAADSITVTRRMGAQAPQTSRLANGGISSVVALPGYATLAVLARNALMRGDTVVIAQFGNDPLPFTVRDMGGVSYSFTAPQLGTFVATVDSRGRVLSLDARPSTLGHQVTRVSDVDAVAWAQAFAARDAAGQGLGPLSPADTVRANVNGANVTIAYQRPSKRGRVIFGGPVVPWGTVWRTGANSATGLTTDRDLVIGGVTVPAGSYTLWTIPQPTQWQLVVNRQTGQWGTVYNAERDLARIPMQVQNLSSPVEQFRIAIENGQLTLAWDAVRASVPIAAR